jgi:hypothetical protein
MKRLSVIGLAAALMVTAFGVSAESNVPPSPNGIAFPAGYQDWRVIGVSHREDNKTLRVIYGNDKAIAAARAGKTNPWPDGAILGKVVWKDTAHDVWEKATVPGKFVHAEFMFKNAKKYASTGGWGWARWKGLAQEPYGKDANVAQECVACHTPVKNNDWVFTIPATLPAVTQ